MTFRCAGMEKDYPKRVQVNGGVVHAAHEVRIGPYTHYEFDKFTGKDAAVKHTEKVVVVPACGNTYSRKSRDYVEIDPTTPITCKNCLKQIGGEQMPAKDSCRFVLQEIASGYFFNKGRWQNRWVEDIYRATLYQNKTSAGSNGHKSYYKHKSSGKAISYADYRELQHEEKRDYKYTSEFDAERFVIREVRLELI